MKTLPKKALSGVEKDAGAKKFGKMSQNPCTIIIN
jgi:hypothetical protein